MTQYIDMRRLLPALIILFILAIPVKGYSFDTVIEKYLPSSDLETEIVEDSPEIKVEGLYIERVEEIDITAKPSALKNTSEESDDGIRAIFKQVGSYTYVGILFTLFIALLIYYRKSVKILNFQNQRTNMFG